MIRKCIRHRTGAVGYKIYTLEEAKEAGIEYKSWREAKQGEYSATDDGMVAICYAKDRYKRGSVHSVFLKYPFGMYSYTEKDGKIPEHIKVLYDKPPPKIGKKGSTKHSYQIMSENKKSVFAIVYLATCDPVVAYQFIYPRTNIHRARYWGRQCLLSLAIKEKIEKELTTLLERRGIARADVPALMEEALEMAREKGDCSNFNRAVENIVKAHFPMEKVKKSFRIIRKSTRQGAFSEIIEEEDDKLQEFGGASDNNILPRVQDIKSDDAGTTTKQTVDVSIVSERNKKLGENQNSNFNQVDKRDKTSKSE